MSQSRTGAVKVKKYQTIERDFAGPPKSDGRVPVIGEVIDLYETLFGWRNARYYNKKGRYLVTDITGYLVLCKIPDDGEVNAVRGRVEGYRIADFKAGLLVYDVIAIDHEYFSL